MNATATEKWSKQVIKQDEIQCYLDGGQDFINDAEIERLLSEMEPENPTSLERLSDVLNV